MILTNLSLVLSKLQLRNVLSVAQNYQVLRFLLLLNLPSQFLQQIAVIFIFLFLQLLNLIIQNLFVCLLRASHLSPFPLKSNKHLFQCSTQGCRSIFFFRIARCLILPPYFKFQNYRFNAPQHNSFST